MDSDKVTTQLQYYPLLSAQTIKLTLPITVSREISAGRRGGEQVVKIQVGEQAAGYSDLSAGRDIDFHYIGIDRHA
jgi:hypothetical protein